MNKICAYCGASFYIKYKSWQSQKFCSRACKSGNQLGKQVKSPPPIHYGSDNHTWKGDSVGYTALHDWVRRKKGTPSLCENCGTTKAPRFYWANKSYEYKRNEEDWERLCGKCHFAKDQNHRQRHPNGRLI